MGQLISLFIFSCTLFIIELTQEGRIHCVVCYSSPQGFIHCFFIRWIYKFGDLKFYCIMRLSVQTFQALLVIYRRVILCIIIENFYQFIGHCLIPLDPWNLPPLQANMILTNWCFLFLTENLIVKQLESLPRIPN